MRMSLSLGFTGREISCLAGQWDGKPWNAAAGKPGSPSRENSTGLSCPSQTGSVVVFSLSCPAEEGVGVVLGRWSGFGPPTPQRKHKADKTVLTYF